MTVSIPMAVTTNGAWNGAVPAGWSLKQLKWAVTFQRGHDLPAEDRHEGSVPVVTGGGIAGYHDVAQASGPGIVTGRYGTIGEFYLIDQDYWPLNTSLYSIDLHGNDVRFLRHMLEPLAPLFHLNAAKSAVPGIDRSDIHTIPVAVPPIATQRAIADCLDRETARLDGLVAAKERVLGLLAEKRRALISRAVTRGLDPIAPLRDSGISWLGEIPAHWERKKLKYVASLKSGDSITSDSIFEAGEYPVFGGNGIRGYTSAYTHCGHYVLIGRQGALCGNINFASGCFWASEHAVVSELKGEAEVTWLGELLRSMNLNQYSQSAAQPGIAVDVIGNLDIPIPPLHEQRDIVAYIAEETAKLDALRTATERTITLLKERRAALIAAAVTGKIAISDENKMSKECQNAI